MTNTLKPFNIEEAKNIILNELNEKPESFFESLMLYYDPRWSSGPDFFEYVVFAFLDSVHGNGISAEFDDVADIVNNDGIMNKVYDVFDTYYEEPEDEEFED